MPKTVFDFDNTLTDTHTFASRRIGLMATRDSEALIALGVIDARTNLKPGLMASMFAFLSFAEDNLFAVATYHNNPDYVAGYIQCLLGKKITALATEVFKGRCTGGAGGDIIRFLGAIRTYLIEGVSKPLFIAYIPFEGAEYSAHIATLQGKNELITMLRMKLSSSGLMGGDDELNFFDDDERNTGYASLLPAVKPYRVDVRSRDFRYVEVPEAASKIAVRDELSTAPCSQAIITLSDAISSPSTRASSSLGATVFADSCGKALPMSCLGAGGVYSFFPAKPLDERLSDWFSCAPSTLTREEAERFSSLSGLNFLRRSSRDPRLIVLTVKQQGDDLPASSLFIHYDITSEAHSNPSLYATKESVLSRIKPLGFNDHDSNVTLLKIFQQFIATGLVFPYTLKRDQAERLVLEAKGSVLRFSSTIPGLLALSSRGADGCVVHHEINSFIRHNPTVFDTPEHALAAIRPFCSGALISPVSSTAPVKLTLS